MSDTQIFNFNKTSITQDPDVMAILGLLYREGPQSEKYICEICNIKRDQFTQERLKLFHMGLIRISEDRRLALTDYAETMLHQLGITDIAAKSLLEGVPEVARSFLRACIEERMAFDASSTKQILHLLRILRAICDQYEWQNDEHVRNVLLRCDYNFIVGLDPDSRKLKGSRYAKQIIKWHETNHSPLWQQFRDDWDANLHTISAMCHSAIDDTDNVDKFLYSFTPRLLTKMSEPNYITTWARLINALLSREPDTGLRYAFRLNKDLPRDSWQCLQTWEPNVFTKTIVILDACDAAWNGLGFEQNYIQSILSDGLHIVFTTHEPSTTSLYFLDYLRNNKRTKLPINTSFDADTKADSIHEQISFLRTQLDQGICDDLSIKQKEELCNDITELAGEFNARLTKKPHLLPDK